MQGAEGEIMQGRKKGVVCLRRIRKAVSMAGNQSRLAKAIGLTRQTVSAWVLGKARPSGSRYRRLVAFVASHGTKLKGMCL